MYAARFWGPPWSQCATLPKSKISLPSSVVVSRVSASLVSQDISDVVNEIAGAPELIKAINKNIVMNLNTACVGMITEPLGAGPSLVGFGIEYAKRLNMSDTSEISWARMADIYPVETVAACWSRHDFFGKFYHEGEMFGQGEMAIDLKCPMAIDLEEVSYVRLPLDAAVWLPKALRIGITIYRFLSERTGFVDWCNEGPSKCTLAIKDVQDVLRLSFFFLGRQLWASGGGIWVCVRPSFFQIHTLLVCFRDSF